MVRWSWIAAIGLAVIIVSVGLVYNWSWLRGDDSPGATIRNVGLILASLIALPLAVWRSYTAHKQVTLAEQDSLDARYQKGADMLSSENISTRIGGVHTLKHLAENHPDRFHIQVMVLLCAFVRHPPKVKEPRKPHGEDFTAALDAIIHRSDEAIATEKASIPTSRRAAPGTHRASEEGFRVNLKGAVLEGADLGRAKLRGAILDHANMSRIWCDDADFSDASMFGCKINDAEFRGTVFDNARMIYADMSHCHFRNCSFVKTDMSSSSPAFVDECANLVGARFIAANLTNTKLENANLSGAKLEKVGEPTKNTTAEVGTSQDEHYCKVTQRQLDSAMANPDNPPRIEEGTTDIETGKPIVWNRELCGGSWFEYQMFREAEEQQSGLQQS